MSNRALLVKQVEALELLANRYSNLKCVNYDPLKDKQTKGNFSLVFKGFDTLNECDVAIKFYDPASSALHDNYRRMAFEREPSLLKQLALKKRCLQLVSGLSEFDLELGFGDDTMKFACKYFVTEWIDGEVDSFFLNQENIEASFKLRLFNEILNAVAALHRCEIHHRDLKSDNLRLRDEEDGTGDIVAIDLGTAARMVDPNLLPEYGHHVGALSYAPPETKIGFSGDREFGKYVDVYALGCLLYELFNSNQFCYSVKQHNNRYDHVIFGMALKVSAEKDKKKKLEVWNEMIEQVRYLIVCPPIDADKSTVPEVIVSELNSLVSDLTNFDFRNRLIDFHAIGRRIFHCISKLENQRATELMNKEKEKWRKNRIAKIEKRKNRSWIENKAGGRQRA